MIRSLIMLNNDDKKPNSSWNIIKASGCAYLHFPRTIVIAYALKPTKNIELMPCRSSPSQWEQVYWICMFSSASKIYLNYYIIPSGRCYYRKSNYIVTCMNFAFGDVLACLNSATPPARLKAVFKMAPQNGSLRKV